VRRLIGPILGVALLAAAAGSVSAAPNRSATLTFACTRSVNSVDGVLLQVDWAGYHPDTLVTVAYSGSSSTQFPTMKVGIDWKFGTSQWDESWADWSSVSVPSSPDSTFAVDLYGKGKFLAETNTLSFSTLTACP
jgi:hypothetical protein